MKRTLLKFSKPLFLATSMLYASYAPLQAGSISAEPSLTQPHNTIILAQATPEKKADAKKKKPTAKKKNPWSVQCGKDQKSGKEFCRMQQSLRFKKTGQRLLAVVIQPQAIEPKLAILLSLPHGLYLPAGTAFKIDDGEENRMLIETCDVEGCYASGGLKQEQVDAMMKGEKMLIAFQASNKKPITIPITLTGFTSAFKKITESK